MSFLVKAWNKTDISVLNFFLVSQYDLTFRICMLNVITSLLPNEFLRDLWQALNEKNSKITLNYE